MLFFYYGTDLTDASLTKIVSAASLGNLGSANPSCHYNSFDLESPEANLLNPKATIQVSCPFGDLFSIAKFGQISRKDKVDCEQIAQLDDASEATFSFYPSECEKS